MNPDVLETYVPLTEAARLARKRFDFIKRLVADGHLPAFRRAGGEVRSTVVVDPKEIGPAILRATRVVPDVSPRLRRVPPARRPGASRRPLNPNVRC